MSVDIKNQKLVVIFNNTNDDKYYIANLKSQKRMDLTVLKSQSGLSNKGWDKGLKGLGKHGLTKVEKTDDGLFVEMV